MARQKRSLVTTGFVFARLRSLPRADQRIARLIGDERLHADNVLVIDVPVQLHLMGSGQRSTFEGKP